jgi:hypothetical protein
VLSSIEGRTCGAIRVEEKLTLLLHQCNKFVSLDIYQNKRGYRLFFLVAP